MSELDADSIFYGDSSPRLAIEDIQLEATEDPLSYAKEIINHCSDQLRQHFLPPLGVEKVRFWAQPDGSIAYRVIPDHSSDINDQERGSNPGAEGVIPAYDIQVDDWFWRLVHARRDS